MTRSGDRKKLYRLADTMISEVADVTATSRQSFRISTRVFVRIEADGDVRSYCFKLSKSEAAEICNRLDYVTPMSFGNMGRKGWVSFRLTQKRQLPLLGKLIDKSRAMFA